jgi:hypothetical protein
MLVKMGLLTLIMPSIVLFDVHTGSRVFSHSEFWNSTALLVGLLAIDSTALMAFQTYRNL